MTNYVSPQETRTNYVRWKSAWKLPTVVPKALGKRAVVEFMPFQCGGNSVMVREGISRTAMVVHDATGQIPAGTEVAIGTNAGDEFTHEARRMCILPIKEVLLMEL